MDNEQDKEEGDDQPQPSLQLPSLHTSFQDFFFKLRLKSWVRRILNNTRSRMYRNITYK